ncbi:hypothetical protein IFR05_011829 [Cadophora sp. M221]|nr:hypothetical protein IFR05_011829 [Cadophora sp. M221]
MSSQLLPDKGSPALELNLEMEKSALGINTSSSNKLGNDSGSPAILIAHDSSVALVDIEEPANASFTCFPRLPLERAISFHEPTVHINCDLDTVYLSRKFCSAIPFGTRSRFECGRNIRLHPSLKSIAFNASELYYNERIGGFNNGDAPTGVQCMEGLFKVYKNIKEIILADTIADTQMPSEGEFEFVEIKDTDDMSKVINVQDQFEKLFKQMSASHDEKIAEKERLRTHELIYPGVLRESSPPGPPEAPFTRPVVKVKGMMRGGVRI